MGNPFDKDELKEKTNRYFKELLFIDSVCEIYISMRHDNEWENIYKVSPAYFALVRKSLLDDMIISLVRLFEDKGRSDYNFYKFVGYLKEKITDNVDVINEVNSFENYIDSKSSLIKNLLKWRDKAIAHLDKEYFITISDLSTDAPLTFDEIKDLISQSFGFLNVISYGLDHSIQHPKYTNQDDYKKLLNIINRSI